MITKVPAKLHIPFSPPDISAEEIEAVVETLKSGWITTGPKTKLFEKKIADYCNTDRAVCLNSATAAMEMTLRILGIGEGDEVITSSYTYSASASIIIHAGAKPVLVDTAPNSYEMDYDQLEKAITSKTKVIIPVDIAGVICDYDRIFEIVNRKKSVFSPKSNIQATIGRVIVLADSAHAFGSQKNGKVCGEIADFTSFSFHAVKNLTTAEGGAVTWRNIDGISNGEIYNQFMLMSLHGQSKDALAKTQLGSWEYDIVLPAYKCNMTDIMASIGLVQLKRYPKILERRRGIIKEYDDALKSENVHILKHSGENYSSCGHLYLVRLNGKEVEYRNKVIEKMAEIGISTNVHYKPLPMHTAYKNMGFNIVDYPNSYNMYKNEITLPLHTRLKDEEVSYVIENFINIINK
ncbi:DegT/DnrJ/EryC1/StrS family aminotransferase [Paenibacillus terrigena]|uniref:DegT/DnrJ/EryC1/StrS family aminotransferase n=1 Tax=Paenibacillus terrigena TaxID=369333 RepID=UPI000367C6DF|nr:DegT/DnrJ/EryC1/StrS aminotransferase family protein [Paenibacillus terrigena]